jgi:hypothetical protein
VTDAEKVVALAAIVRKLLDEIGELPPDSASVGAQRARLAEILEGTDTLSALLASLKASGLVPQDEERGVLVDPNKRGTVYGSGGEVTHPAYRVIEYDRAKGWRFAVLLA